MKKTLKKWWKGEPYYLDGFSATRYRKHWTSKLAHSVIALIRKYGKEVLYIMAAIATIVGVMWKQ
jgi:hypothetical protein